ncbi:hypothetical protein GIB67_034083 [Kingdonia uniflora]|uniref:DNA/RNA helicase protein n=1 Tax=Kingdonia uniflora TaxID=39325 RepID=A0A7J7M6J1_9MAGN|nr:hypothetical protein GIB67_034083 [Kingdonia uniflora]
MGNKVTDELVTMVRSIIGEDYTNMDIIRALHMSNNDVTAAINIIFDTPNIGTKERSETRRPPKISNQSSNSESRNQSVAANSERVRNDEAEAASPDSDGSEGPSNCFVESRESEIEVVGSSENEWWLAGSSELAGLSTCKGRKLKVGDEVMFTFPIKNNNPPSATKLAGRGRSPSACSEIVRFSTKDSGEIGRIPNEWARCLVPLVKDKKVRIEGQCKYAPDVLGIMDTILLSVSVYINSSMFRKLHQTSLKTNRNVTEESVVHPLPSLFRLLGLTPFKKAELTPEDLYSRKRPLDSKENYGLQSSHLSTKKSPPQENPVENEQEPISDSALDNIIGSGDSSQIEEMDPPSTLQCELRSYQKQALNWMIQLERGRCLEKAETTLHPCWDAYHLADKRELVVYLNAFSGDATTEFPSTLQMSRGGILADAMGLGKTIMTIALLLVHSGRGGSSGSHVKSQISGDTNEISSTSDQSPKNLKKITKFSGFDKLMQSRTSLIGGGNLIVCPMTLLGQWKAEIETHGRQGSLSIYVHYGQSRPKDAKLLAQSDVVLTTYGVLASEFSTENAEASEGLYSVRWFRVVLDEAHTIKSSKSQVSMAAAALAADRRWCLTGTPIQNNLEDIYSLLRFLRIEPWSNWGLWNKLIQKPFEEGDERGLKLVQSILRSIMLRRTKFSTNKEGKPILVLPPADVAVIYCQLSDAEKDFYEALFKRSKVKFDQFVEQGRVLHNYASILELLLRLRQCCDHPFLVMRGNLWCCGFLKFDCDTGVYLRFIAVFLKGFSMGLIFFKIYQECATTGMSGDVPGQVNLELDWPMRRGDTQEFADLNKLSKRFLKGGQDVAEGDSDVLPSKAYIEEVVEELRKGEKGECPICLEAFEDAVLTPCAHRLCRECLLASWQNHTSGLCPVCRKIVNKQDLITAPTDSRFHIDVEKNWVESSKVAVLMHELENLRSSGSKSIVFSQWTGFLDLLQIPLSRNNISFLRLDGTLSQQHREKVIKQFSEENDILVLLMSLKAGGVGINLTAASNAFVLDPWWNPAVEEQAVMRIHRIGQTKRVAIKRFIVKGTVEERMEAVQARKQRMIAGALTDQEVRTARIEELKMLFT